MKKRKLNKEAWMNIKDYEGLYQISSLGRVYNVKTDRILSPSFCCGYPRVGLVKDKKQRTFQIHRLIAIAFIPNSHNYPCINHKDETRTNNSIPNLEWCSYKYNSNYGTFPERVGDRFAKPVVQKTKSGEIIKIYKSAKQAEREIGVCSSNIIKCINGKLKTAGKFIWENVNEDYKGV